MGRFDKYIEVTRKLQYRYAEKGTLVLSVGGVPSKYSRLEEMAATKYLGVSGKIGK
jgi:hypothetical protein